LAQFWIVAFLSKTDIALQTWANIKILTWVYFIIVSIAHTYVTKVRSKSKDILSLNLNFNKFLNSR